MKQGRILPLAITSGFVFAAQGALVILVQLYLRELDAQPLIISLTTSLGWLGILMGGTFWGMISSYRSRESLFFVILATSAVTIGVLALLPSALGVLPAVFLRVFIITGITPIAMTIVSKASSMRRRGRNLSFISSAKTLGFMLGGAIAGFLLEAGSFRWSFLALACLPLCAFPFLICLPQQEKVSLRQCGAPSKWRWLAIGKLKSLYLGVILRQAGMTGAGSLVFVYMASLEIPAGTMGLVQALGPAVSTVGVLVFGWLADRIKKRGILLFGFGVAGFSPLIFAFACDAWGMAAGYLTLGMSFAAYYAGSTTHIADVISLERQGTMLGFLESSRGLGGVLGPLIAGAITPAIGFQGMFLTMAGIAALGFLSLLCDRDKRA